MNADLQHLANGCFPTMPIAGKWQDCAKCSYRCPQLETQSSDIVKKTNGCSSNAFKQDYHRCPLERCHCLHRAGPRKEPANQLPPSGNAGVHVNSTAMWSC